MKHKELTYNTGKTMYLEYCLLDECMMGLSSELVTPGTSDIHRYESQLKRFAAQCSNHCDTGAFSFFD
jgi:hypothetical protein